MQRSVELVELADAAAVCAWGRGWGQCSCGRLGPEGEVALGFVESLALLFQTADGLVEFIPVETELGHGRLPSFQGRRLCSKTPYSGI